MNPAATAFDPSPAGGRQRILALDAVRGVAVAGIVPMNVIAFAMPAAAYVSPRVYGGADNIDLAGWLAVFLLVEDKFRALFALLFGAGVAILLERGGARPLAGHHARMAVLFAIGLAHATLIASNDILRVYAVGGLLLPLVLGWPVRRLCLAAGAIVVGQMAATLWLYRDYLAAWLDWRATGTDSVALQAMRYQFGGDPGYVAQALDQGREGFAERLARRWRNEPAYSLRVMGGLPSSLAAMLVGIALWRSGLLAGAWTQARAWRLACLLALLALVPLAALAAADIASGFDPVVTLANAYIWSAPFDIIGGVAWAAGLIALFTRGGALTRLWAATGRLALTNYLMTSLVLATLFASWGLGLFGAVGRAHAYALAAIPVALMLALSPLWLARFGQGPAERAWRGAARIIARA